MKNNKALFYINIIKRNALKYIFYFILAFIISIIPLITGHLLKKVFYLLEKRDISNLIIIIIIWIATIIINSFLLFYNSLNEVELRFRLNKDLKITFISQLVFSQNLNQNDNGEILNILNTDSNAIEYTICNILDFINKFIFFVIIIIVLAYLNLELAVYTISPLLIFNLIIHFIRDRYKEKFSNLRENEIIHSKFIYNLIDNIQVSQYIGKKENFIRELRKKAKEKYLSRMKKTIFFSALDNGVILVNTVCIFILMFTLANLNTNIKIGDFTLFISYLSFGASYLNIFSVIVSDYKYIESFLERISIIIGINRSKNFIRFKNDKQIKQDDIINTLRLKDFKTKNSKKINLLISKPLLISVVSQKSSIEAEFIEALLGLKEYSGKIIVNEREIKSLKEYHIGYVSREINLFSASINENINWNNKEKLDSEGIKISNIFQDKTFRKENQNLRIISKGLNISLGQRQRLSIARAYELSKNIILINDGFSFVDYDNKVKIINSLKESGKTIIYAGKDNYINEISNITLNI